MPQLRRLLLPVFVVLTLTSILTLGTGCERKSDDGNLMVLHLSFWDDMKTWDPANGYDHYTSLTLAHVYETLYQEAYLSDNYKLVPLLAADMPRYSPDRKTVTIPIKRGVRFHDNPCFKETGGKGRELRAEDFVYAFKRLALPALHSSGWWLLDGKIQGINEFHQKLLNTPKGDVPKVFVGHVEGIRAVDSHTLQIKLTKPYPQLLHALSMSFTAPVPTEAVEAYADEQGNIINQAVGTGPFALKKWQPGKEIILERNPSYHPEFYPTEGSIEFRKKGLLADSGKPLPFLDRIAIRIIKEQQPSWLEFMKGRFDLIEIPKDNFDQAITQEVNLTPELAAKGIRLSIDNGVSFFYVAFNMKDKLLGGNRYLRQAISSAIDRDKWISVFTNGTARKQVTILPPGIPDRPKNSHIKYDYNLSLAKELMKKAGYPEGKGLPVLSFDMRSADSKARQFGDFFAQQLGAIGIKINVIYNTFPAFLGKMKQGNLQISFGAWAMDYPDPENAYQTLYGPNKAPGPNDVSFDHPEYNALFEKMAVLEAGSDRAAVVQKLDQIVQEEMPWALGYYKSTYFVSQPWLLNFRASEFIRNRYKYVRINRDVKKRYLEIK